MRALVISGGGSKGAFAGGVAQYLMEREKREYDMFLGTSTGSLLVPHLAVNEIGKLYDIFTNVSQQDIFSIRVKHCVKRFVKTLRMLNIKR